MWRKQAVMLFHFHQCANKDSAIGSYLKRWLIALLHECKQNSGPSPIPVALHVVKVFGLFVKSVHPETGSVDQLPFSTTSITWTTFFKKPEISLIDDVMWCESERCQGLEGWWLCSCNHRHSAGIISVPSLVEHAQAWRAAADLPLLANHLYTPCFECSTLRFLMTHFLSAVSKYMLKDTVHSKCATWPFTLSSAIYGGVTTRNENHWII